MPAVVLDTNVFVAAAFNPRSASARLVEDVWAGRRRMRWHDATLRETEHVVRKIPPLSWEAFAAVFRDADRYDGPLDTAPFAHVPDPGDRKFAALAAATGAVLVTMDAHLLGSRQPGDAPVTTPGALARDLDRS